MSKALLDMQTADDRIHDDPTYEITDEQMATELLRLLPWLKGKKSYDDFKNEVRALAQKLGLLNKGSSGWRNRYEAKGLAKPEDRQPELSLNAEWPEPTEEQRRAAGTFPTRLEAQCTLSIQLGLGADGRADGAGMPPAMTAERVKQVVAELEASRGHGGSPLA
jgi:hypothetical protein